MHQQVKVKRPVKNKTYFCLAYDEDFNQAYAFYCARYRDVTKKEFLKLGITEFNIKISSIPESEPLFTILKSRVINLSTIKDKDQRKYWSDLKRKNKIPSEYLSTKEIFTDLQKFSRERKI